MAENPTTLPAATTNHVITPPPATPVAPVVSILPRGEPTAAARQAVEALTQLDLSTGGITPVQAGTDIGAAGLAGAGRGAARAGAAASVSGVRPDDGVDRPVGAQAAVRVRAVERCELKVELGGAGRENARRAHRCGVGGRQRAGPPAPRRPVPARSGRRGTGRSRPARVPQGDGNGSRAAEVPTASGAREPAGQKQKARSGRCSGSGPQTRRAGSTADGKDARRDDPTRQSGRTTRASVLSNPLVVRRLVESRR